MQLYLYDRCVGVQRWVHIPCTIVKTKRSSIVKSYNCALAPGSSVIMYASTFVGLEISK